MRPEIYATLSVGARQVVALERTVLAMGAVRRQFASEGLPDLVFQLDSTISMSAAQLGTMKRGLFRLLKGEPVYEYVQNTPGLGPAVALVLGLLPPLTEFPKKGQRGGPYHVNSYMGLAVVNGRCPKREAGKFAGYSTLLQGFAISRLAEPCIKCDGPFRDQYDIRRVRTAETHPLMLDEGCPHCDEARAASKKKRAESRQTRERKSVGKDCSNFGGPHWTLGHQHRDAIRVVAKAVMLDLWLVENGKQPRYGAGSSSESVDQMHHAGA